ncbi:MAG: basic amino acid ABC transporter substrate-binding protein [Anaerovoracaceae bacterium]|jgi:ABC-type amino acid transport substrate-binding protein
MKKSLLTKLAVIGMSVAVAFAFSACGSSDSSSDSSSSEKETYVVGAEPTFAPFDTTDENGDFDGFDKDMMDAIAKDQGFKVKYKTMSFDSLIPALNSGTIDIIASGMNCQSKERKEKVDFSKVYYDSGLIVVVKKGSKIKSIDDVDSSMKVASQTGTTGADKANSLAEKGKISEAVILDGYDTCMQQLSNGDVAAVIIDKPVADNYLAKQPGKFKEVGDIMNAEGYGIGVKKGNKALLKKINKGLNDIIDSGEFQKICKKWKIKSKY